MNCNCEASEVNQAQDRSYLGIYAKSHPALESKGFFLGGDSPSIFSSVTGERLVEVGEDSSAKLERWALHSVAQHVLRRTEHRIRGCCRWMLKSKEKGRSAVQVYRSFEHGSCSYGGLQTCGSVWCCPVCAAKITERRRVELKQAIGIHEERGGGVVLLTLTHPHTKTDRLADLLVAEQKAMTRFFGSRAGVGLMASMGRVGHVRGWEVTHGRKRGPGRDNGWHPHFHILLFLKQPLGVDERLVFENSAYELWLRVCQKAGLGLPSRRYGVRLDDGSKAAEYAAKFGLEEPRWGLDAEMTKAHVKRVKDGEGPFDLLRSVLCEKDRTAPALFREYADSFKGKRQLVWSRGLRDFLNLRNDISDEELAAEIDDHAELLGQLTILQWRLILFFDVRGELLQVAQAGWEAVLHFLSDLRIRELQICSTKVEDG
ncbi:MAG: protein rep [Trichococcus flocculiformis]|jgi:hypothetical protein